MLSVKNVIPCATGEQSLYFKKKDGLSGVMAHACNPSTGRLTCDD